MAHDTYGWLVLDTLIDLLKDKGVTRIFYKKLGRNNNSKQQVYLGKSLEVLSVLPTEDLIPSTSDSAKESKTSTKFTAHLPFSWIDNEGSTHPAPNAQLIFYPQYPEVRFSGFLSQCSNAPSDLMQINKRGKEEGRILILGVTPCKKILGYIVPSESALAQHIGDVKHEEDVGVLKEIQLEQKSNRLKLLEELKRIHQLGWITGRRLTKSQGIIQSKDCFNPNCGGYTLEAELGIYPNGLAEPDFLGWEIKQIGKVKDFNKSHALTLMTPEPTGGIYKTAGVQQFVRKYGYPDKKIADRLNFNSKHSFHTYQPSTSLTMNLRGYDEMTYKMIDPFGAVELTDPQGNVAAEWSFQKLMNHWKNKHSKTAFVLSENRPNQENGKDIKQYKYRQNVCLGEGRDFLKVLQAISQHQIYHDPGIKVENASSPKPKHKCRNQFRVNLKDLSSLFDNLTKIDLTSI